MWGWAKLSMIPYPLWVVYLIAVYTWWNHLYECGVGPLLWDIGKVSRALMNYQACAWPISAKPRCTTEIFSSVNWLKRPLTYIKSYRFIETISFTYNSVGYVSFFLDLIHSPKDIKSMIYTYLRIQWKCLFCFF